MLFLVIFGWVNLATVLSLSHPDSAPFTVLRLFSPFAFFTLHDAWCRRHGLARVAVVLHRLAARPVRDRGPGGAPARGRGRVRSRIIRALGIAGAAAVIMLVLAALGGFPHAVTA